MRTSTKKLLRRGMIVTSAGLALLLAQTGTAAACPAPGFAQRTVTTAKGSTFHLSLFARSTVLPASGGQTVVEGVGYNTAQGIFLEFCAIPSTVTVGDPTTYTALPTFCLPGHATKDGSSRRITNTATGTPGITIPYGPGGSFHTTLDNLRPQLPSGDICDVTVQCAVITRGDFTATKDRSYDQYIPVHFVR